MRIVIFLFLLFVLTQAMGQELTYADPGKESSIRAVAVVNPSTIWMSGSKGWFAKSLDGGRQWKWKQLGKYKELDFRGIYAFSDRKAILMSSGTPAVILRTTDGGESWMEAYRNESKEIFLDGISFWNDKEGLVYGDPINSRMQLLKSTDGGLSWNDVSATLHSQFAEGEASFAASNTGICTWKDKTWIISGGSQSRIFYSRDKGQTWIANPLPIIHGRSTTGPFSVAFLNEYRGVIAGGDYASDTLSERNMLLTNDGGKSWAAPVKGPSGYKSCICWINDKALIATGTSGTDISRDGGRSWSLVSKEGFNVVERLTENKAILAGAKGRIAILSL